MWTKEKQRESNRKYRLAHPERAIESVRKWQKAHPEQVRETQRKYRLEHPQKSVYNREKYLRNRDKILARQKTPEQKAKQQKYYVENRDKFLKYYEDHKEERITYSKQHRRLHRVCGKGNNPQIYGVNKPLYPIDERCEYCHRVSFKSLHWHHWSDDVPEDGFWVCQGCHRHIEFLFRHATDKTKFINDFKSQFPLNRKVLN